MIFKNITKTITNNYLPWCKLKYYDHFKWGRVGGKVVGNGVVILGGKHLIKMPKLRRLR